MKPFKMPFLIKLQQRCNYPFKLGLMDKLYGKKLGRSGIVWAPISNGLHWKLDMNMVVHRWMAYDTYDKPFIKWAEKNVSNNSIIIDSGANIGQSLAYFVKIANQGKVLAFEPDDEAYSWLKECIRLNEVKNAELIPKGLGETSKEAFLDVPPDGNNSNLHAFWSVITDSNQGKKIEITTLEEELRQRNIKNVSLWKLDVEGYEIPALNGARALLENRMINALYIELSTKQMNHQKIISYMNEIGYQLHYLSPKGKPIKSEKVLDFQSDGLFLPLK